MTRDDVARFRREIVEYGALSGGLGWYRALPFAPLGLGAAEGRRPDDARVERPRRRPLPGRCRPVRPLRDRSLRAGRARGRHALDPRTGAGRVGRRGPGPDSVDRVTEQPTRRRAATEEKSGARRDRERPPAPSRCRTRSSTTTATSTSPTATAGSPPRTRSGRPPRSASPGSSRSAATCRGPVGGRGRGEVRRPRRRRRPAPQRGAPPGRRGHAGGGARRDRAAGAGPRQGPRGRRDRPRPLPHRRGGAGRAGRVVPSPHRPRQAARQDAGDPRPRRPRRGARGARRGGRAGPLGHALLSGDAAFARACLDRGAHLSFAGTVTFKNADPLRGRSPVTPQDRVLVETDAPFLTPTPYRGRPNASYLVPGDDEGDGGGARG